MNNLSISSIIIISAFITYLLAYNNLSDIRNIPGMPFITKISIDLQKATC